jgi:hypothetical protein
MSSMVSPCVWIARRGNADSRYAKGFGPQAGEFKERFAASGGGFFFGDLGACEIGPLFDHRPVQIEIS